jgi:hypothetical protein
MNIYTYTAPSRGPVGFADPPPNSTEGGDNSNSGSPSKSKWSVIDPFIAAQVGDDEEEEYIIRSITLNPWQVCMQILCICGDYYSGTLIFNF